MRTASIPFAAAAGTAAKSDAQEQIDTLTAGNYSLSVKLNVHSDKLSSLMQAFIKSAQVSADGKTIVVGDFEARKSNLFQQFMGINWRMYESTGATEAVPATKKFRRFLTVDSAAGATEKDIQGLVIGCLASEAAEKLYTKDDAKAALKQALQAKLATLS